jgi:hypothetical protein
MATFDDGTPLDASLLQDFDRRLVELKASIPKIGATPGNPGSGGGGNQTVNPSQIVGNLHTGVKLSPGAVTPFRVNFDPPLLSTPKSVTLTPVRTANIPSVFSFAVDSKTVGPSGFNAQAYLNSSAKNEFTIGFYWMAMCF